MLAQMVDCFACIESAFSAHNRICTHDCS
jgi:hypothetical protein